jgi:hypothetical protein
MCMDKIKVKEPRLHCRNCGTHIDEHESNPCLDQWVQYYVMDDKSKTIKPYSTDANLIPDIILRCHYIAIRYSVPVHPEEVQVTVFPTKASFKYFAQHKSLTLAVCRAIIKAVADQKRWERYL